MPSQKAAICLLFERAQLARILEDIYFNLDPKSLLSCSLVCKQWNSFLQKHVWTTPNGERRLVHAWTSRIPAERRMALTRTSRFVCSMVADQDYIVVCDYEKIVLYGKKTGRRLKKLHAESVITTSLLLMGSRYLIVAPIRTDFQGTVLVFQVQNRFQQLAMEEAYPGIGQTTTDWTRMVMAKDDILVVQQHIKNCCPGPCCGPHSLGTYVYRICDTTLRYHLLWQAPHLSTVCLSSNLEKIVLADCNFLGNFEFRLKDVTDGRRLQSTMTVFVNRLREILRASYRYIVSMSYEESLLAVMTAIYLQRAKNGIPDSGYDSFKVYLCDMQRRVTLRKLNLDYPMYFGCDITKYKPTIWVNSAVMNIATRGKVLVWDLRALLAQEGKEMRPDRVFEAKGTFQFAFPIMSQGRRLVYPSYKEEERMELVECDFWGKDPRTLGRLRPQQSSNPMGARRRLRAWCCIL